MGNKRRLLICRTRKDPRTKGERRRRKTVTGSGAGENDAPERSGSPSCAPCSNSGCNKNTNIQNNNNNTEKKDKSPPSVVEEEVITASEIKLLKSATISIPTVPPPGADTDTLEPLSDEEGSSDVEENSASECGENSEENNSGDDEDGSCSSGDDEGNNSGCYVLMDTGILFPILDQLIKCPRCGYIVHTMLLLEQKNGLAHEFSILCRNIACKWEHRFFNSRQVFQGKCGSKPFDVNLRAHIAFREIGRGHNAIETLCGYMNMPPPMTEHAYNETTKKLHPVYMDTVTKNMQDGAEEIGQTESIENEDDEPFDEIRDTAVSVDGSWQRRGYSSLNGVFTTISIDTGKCLDFECLVKTCKSCEIWAGKKGTKEYDDFVKQHHCMVNHKGSAPAMESEGVVKIFKRTVDKLKLRFTTYIGDGDSKAFPSVTSANPYGPNKPVVKGECIGHIQKRVGTRLRKYKKEHSKKVLKDNKKLGGQGRLTDKSINRLQNYYGLAIRQNCDNLAKMRRAVGAVLYHCSEARSTEARHMFCDPDSEWCKYRLAARSDEDYKEKPGLPAAIRDEIKHVFQDLSSEELLKKCLHGQTQNNNESLNGFIWKRLPKDIFVGRNTFEIGVASAVLNFNSGGCELLKVIKILNMDPGIFTLKYCGKRDKLRIKKVKRKMSTKGKNRRKKRRAIRKGFNDKHEAEEGEVYGAGLF